LKKFIRDRWRGLSLCFLFSSIFFGLFAFLANLLIDQEVFAPGGSELFSRVGGKLQSRKAGQHRKAKGDSINAYFLLSGGRVGEACRLNGRVRLAECGVRGILDSKYNLGRIEEQGLNLGTGGELGTGLVINAVSQHDFLLIYFVYLVHPIYFHIHNIFYPLWISLKVMGPLDQGKA
jgi:hypothetical protein